MKTLDEAVKFVSGRQHYFDKNGCFECHYCGDNCIDSCILESVLKYLKEYKDTKQQLLDGMARLEKYEEQFIKAKENHEYSSKEENRILEDKMIYYAALSAIYYDKYDKWLKEGGEQFGKTIVCKEKYKEYKQFADWLKELISLRYKEHEK